MIDFNNLFDRLRENKLFYPIFFTLIGCFFIVLPILVQDPAKIKVLNDVGLYAILALSLNIILGYAGLFHMGHGAFYAIGAYLPAILIVQLGIDIPILLLIPLCGLLSGLFALVVARPIIHLRGDYLLIVTIGLVEIVRIILVNDVGNLSGGDNGIFGIPRPSIFGYIIKQQIDFYYLIWIFVLITVILFYRLENSRFGRALRYIKEDELAAEGCGINTTHYKLIAFVIGAVWAGMAGNVYAGFMKTIAPKSFDFEMSVKIFTIVLLGGAGSIHGVIIGAFLIIGLPEIFRELENYRMLVFGLAMIFMMIFRNKGLFPPLLKKYKIPGIQYNTEKSVK